MPPSTASGRISLERFKITTFKLSAPQPFWICLGLVLLTTILPFVGADFQAVISNWFLEPFNELLQFFLTASQKIDIVSKPQVVYCG